MSDVCIYLIEEKCPIRPNLSVGKMIGQVSISLSSLLIRKRKERKVFWGQTSSISHFDIQMSPVTDWCLNFIWMIDEGHSLLLSYFYLLLSFSHFSHHQASPLATTDLFSVSIFLGYTFKINHGIFVFLWLVSLSITLSSFIYVVPSGKILFFLFSICFLFIEFTGGDTG